MPYVTAQELIERLGEREATAISDRFRTGQPDVSELTRALASAEAEVNGYVGRRYLLPLTNATTGQQETPEQLKGFVIDVARYRQTGTEIMETEAIRTRYKDAVRVLEQIADGRYSLGNMVLAGAGGPAAVGGAFAVRTGCKTFNMDQVL